jgi:hypothetical protein
MHLPAFAVFWLKTIATELHSRLKAAFQALLNPIERKPVPSIHVGDNNSGNVYINCPVYLSQSPAKMTVESPSRPSIESN